MLSSSLYDNLKKLNINWHAYFFQVFTGMCLNSSEIRVKLVKMGRKHLTLPSWENIIFCHFISNPERFIFWKFEQIRGFPMKRGKIALLYLRGGGPTVIQLLLWFSAKKRHFLSRVDNFMVGWLALGITFQMLPYIYVFLYVQWYSRRKPRYVKGIACFSSYASWWNSH